MSVPLEVLVDGLGSKGDGVVHQGGRRLFVDGALAGERVLVRVDGQHKPGDVRAELVQILQPAPERVTPPCRHAAECGACRLQHQELAAFGRFLQGKVRAALEARGLDGASVAAADISPPHDRRRLRLAWQRTVAGTVLGTRMVRSYRIVDLQECVVAAPALVSLLPGLRGLLGRLSAASGEVALDLTDVGVDLLIVASKPPGRSDLTGIPGALAELPGVCRISWKAERHSEPETLVTLSEPWLQHGPLRVPMVPGGFRQATAHGEATMRRFLNQHLAGSSHVVDLFGGTGALSLGLDPLPRKVQVVEADAHAVAALAQGLRGGVKGSNVTVLRRDLDRQPMTPMELRGVDAVILDPPRAGARSQSEALAKGMVGRIAYVSCDPGSFARDARILVDGGYRLGEVAPIGQFLWSAEVELAAIFHRDPA